MEIQVKNKNALQSVLQILRETSENFNVLYGEATMELRIRKNATGYMEKLTEQAQLLIHLPQRLEPFLQNLDCKIRQKIVWDTEWFASQAKEAVQWSSKSSLLLGALLINRGTQEGDKNSLEDLITFLEK